MVDTEQLKDFKEKILTIIEFDEDFAREIYRIVIKKYGDILLTKTYLDEALEKQNKNFEEKLEQQNRSFEEKLEQMNKKFEEKLEEQNRSFEEKLEQMSKKFEEKLEEQNRSFEEKLEQMNKNFEEKLEQLDKKFEEKLEQLDKKFEEKLEQMNKKFEEKLLLLKAEITKEFDEKLDKQTKNFDEKFEKLIIYINKRFDENTERIIKYIDKRFGEVGSRWGEASEKAIKNAFHKVLKEFNGKVKKWRKVEKFINKNGYKGQKRYEIDIVITNDKIILMEVKSSCSKDDLYRFIENCDYFEKNEKVDKPIEKYILTFYMDDEVHSIAEKNNISVISASDYII